MIGACGALAEHRHRGRVVVDVEADSIDDNPARLHGGAERDGLRRRCAVSGVAIDVIVVRTRARERVLRDDAVAICGVESAVGHEHGDLLRVRRAISGRALRSVRPQIAPVRRQHVPAPSRADLAGGGSACGERRDARAQRSAICGQRDKARACIARVAGARVVAADEGRARRRIRGDVGGDAFGDAIADLQHAL